MFGWYPIPFLIVAVVLLIRAELTTPRDIRQVRIWKPTASALFIAVAAFAFYTPSNKIYTTLVLIGLILSFVGDVLLIDGDKPAMFVRGLVAFLLAHLVYIAAFTHIQGARNLRLDLTKELIAFALLSLLLMVVYFYLRSHLGAFRQPVLFYMVVISLMVHRAAMGVSFEDALLSQPMLAVSGALFFYISDFILAINKFVFDGEDKMSNVWVLVAYYIGQTLIASSAILA
jgi:uncharacterized membrane protein YhhN